MKYAVCSCLAHGRQNKQTNVKLEQIQNNEWAGYRDRLSKMLIQQNNFNDNVSKMKRHLLMHSGTDPSKEEYFDLMNGFRR